MLIVNRLACEQQLVNRHIQGRTGRNGSRFRCKRVRPIIDRLRIRRQRNIQRSRSAESQCRETGIRIHGGNILHRLLGNIQAAELFVGTILRVRDRHGTGHIYRHHHIGGVNRTAVRGRDDAWRQCHDGHQRTNHRSSCASPDGFIALAASTDMKHNLRDCANQHDHADRRA